MAILTSFAPLYPEVAGHTIVRECGRGMYATVFEARPSHSSTRVAVKVLHPHWVDNSEISEGFREEADRLASCRHRNIVTGHGFVSTVDGAPAMKMEFVEGSTLKDYSATLQKGHSVGRSVIVSILDQLASAIDYLNGDRKIAHLDVRPANILVVATRHRSLLKPPLVKLGDLGLSRIVHSQSSYGNHNEYSAPETFHPPSRFTKGTYETLGLRRADLYSLGVLATELLAEFPLTGARDRSGSWVKKVPLRAEFVLAKAMNDEPARRYNSATEFVTELKEAFASKRWPEKAALGAVSTAAVGAVGYQFFKTRTQKEGSR
jgi:eukaryotic-like serine/threonine-protein kinase